MADRQVKVTLSAQVAGYVQGMEQAAKATRDTGSEADKLAQKQQAFETMGRAAMVAGGAMAAGIALSTKAAIDWDSAWAGVTKTVDGTDDQLASIEAGLRGLAKELPASHSEIAAVAEAAGQLGIKTPNIVEFTKTMIDMGETTNLSAETAATSLARFMTVMGTAQGEVSGLGSALVALGNNYATTEAEIMEMAMRLSGAGAQIGMSEGQVLGLSTALSSVGIEAEAGGSAMSKVMIDIASSADKGGERIGMFANVAGMSADEFTAKWKSDPGAALAAFVKGLANAEAQGKSTFGILEDLGISEVRMRDALLRSSSAADQFSDAMETGNRAMGENTALTDEANKRYETTAAKLGMMRNRVVDAAISLGDHFLPVLESGAEAVGSFADLLAGMDGPMGGVVAWGGLIASGILLTGGMALAAVPKIAAYKVALETLNVNTSAIGGKLRGVAGFLGGPWGVAMLGAGLAVRGFNSAMDASKVSAQEMENAIKQGTGAFDAMVNRAGQNEQGMMKALVDVSQHLDDLPALADKAATSGRGFWSSMSFNENAALDNIKELGDALASLAASDLPEAQRAFSDFVHDSGLNDAQALTFMNEEMAGFKSTLIDAAKAAGVATDDASLLKFALGEIGPAAEDAADGADAGEESLDGLGNTAAETQDAIKKLADEIRGFNAPVFDMRDANRRLEESYVDLGKTLSEHGHNFDIASEAGRQNQAALDDVASATNRAAAAIFEATGSQDEMNAKLAEGRNSLIDILAPYFESRDAAAAYVDQLNLISPEKVTEVIANTEGATANVEGVNDLPVPDKLFEIHADNAAAFEGIEGVNVKKINDKTAYVWGDTKDATKRIEELNNKQTPRKVVEVSANTSAFESAWSSITGRVGSAVVSIFGKKESANGNIFAHANGGIQAYAGGGFATGIYSGGAPIHKFAEPETGWEAYISGKPDQRDRNRQIWAETGRRLGIDDAKQGTTVNVKVYAAPGMDEEALTRRVVRELEGKL